MLERIKRNTLLTACIENKNDLFDAIKRQRKCKPTFVTTIDGHTEDIPGHLATTYEKLYNSANDEEVLSLVESSPRENICEANFKT